MRFAAVSGTEDGRNVVSAPRSITFALIPGPARQTASTVAEAEAIGFDGVWLGDQGFGYDPFVAVAAAAAATSKIRLGIGLTTPFTRLPLQIARAVASLHDAADGRVALALGTGNLAHVLRPLGISAERPVPRLREATAAIRSLLRGDAIPGAGNASVALDIPGSIDVPIYFGTRRPGMLRLAGEIGDGVLAESLFGGSGPEYVMANVAEGAARAGRPLDDVDVVAWQVVVVTDDPERVVGQHRPWAARTIQNGPVEAMERIGVGAAVYEQVMAAMSRSDRAAAIAAVPDSAVTALMAIDRPDAVAARLQTALSRGATSVNVLYVGSPEGLVPNLRRFAEEVMPLLRAGGGGT
jgi:5,10-methylenetetrahydromethanopterin reductase